MRREQRSEHAGPCENCRPWNGESGGQEEFSQSTYSGKVGQSLCEARFYAFRARGVPDEGR
jgi:hypothetical protein